MATLDLNYPAITKLFGVHAMKQRSESRAFLAWFLENYYRLDQIEVGDSICDGNYDKGIDGIYVNDQLGQIDVFQSMLTRGPKTLGDTALKEFSGTLSQLSDKRAVTHLTTSAKNPELVALLKALEIAEKVDDSYDVRGVFLKNAKRDDNAIQYLKHNPHIVLFDHDELQASYAPLDKTPPIATVTTFNIADVPHMEYPLTPKVNMVIASLPAQDLVKMSGIASGELFVWNVRQWLGRKTKVNKDIETSILTPEEHPLFPAFHNGLTVLCKSLRVRGDKIAISGYAVVNGCQSLTTLYEHRHEVTPELRIITKFINVSPDDELAAKITDHTNNQNGTTFRDMQSNNPIQLRLQSEVQRLYPGVFYRIKRGEHPEWPPESVIENVDAARMLLAFDLKQPSACHQTYKLFDELHTDIFGRPDVTADRIVMVHDLYDIIIGLIGTMKNQLFGHYGLTRYLILFLVREALELDTVGKQLCASPTKFVRGDGSREKFSKAILKTAKCIVNLLDTEATRRSTGKQFFDYKSDLKSPARTNDLFATIIGQYKVIVDNEYTSPFSREWADDGKPKASEPAKGKRVRKR